ncbi:RHS repeat-associated core domain-containing protein [Lentzea sp.]|uniref:RHS repeat-associated core domain-containing protein n=1 Tax=Lentzea sp. TaxID=56099 RepID=UPI002ED05053
MPAPEQLKDAAWPAAGEGEVVLPKTTAVPRRADLGEPAVTTAHRVGSLPVLVAVPDRSRGGDAKVRVRVADQEVARRAGITGVVLSVAPSTSGKVEVAVDYSSFLNAAGASYASRLRLVALPACVLTTPDKAECRTRTPLASRNDAASQTVTADVDTARTEQVLAALADSSGASGSFTASSLSPSGSWGVTGNTGAFTWSYPIALPPAGTGKAIEPKVALSYNSATVDGRTAATNNQPGWIGQGWNYEPGFVERTYRPCADDDKLPEANRTGDLCWAGPVVTMSLNGQTAALVWDENKNIWRSTDDNGAKVELATGASNGAHNGEHWKVTTTDGLQYFFGLNRLPGSSAENATNSAWTVPVYSPRSDGPCHSTSGFAQSKCDMGWRFNLDYVEDPHGNAVAYYYSPETNQYGQNNGTTGVNYTRGGTLKRIDYGLRKVSNSVYASVAPDQVLFNTSERCIPADGFDCDPTKFTAANAKHWPDTPQDQQCVAGKACDNHAPTFWSTKRLTSITTQYNLGSTPVKVDTYELAQQFPGAVDKELWLDSITRTGHSASPAITVPPIRFSGQVYANRVSGFNNQPKMEHWRLGNITTDTGAVITVTYSTPDCTLGSMPTDAAHNDKRCFPVYWAPPLNENPILDYFHKYVATKVEQQDANALSPTQVTEYTYVGAPAWHYDDNEVVKPKYRTYGQFRGYSEVETRTGNPATAFDDVPDTRTLLRTRYFRGMDGDQLPGGGKRTASVSSSLGDSITDEDVFAGSPRETQSFNGENGSRLTSAINDPVKVATTATRNRDGLPALTANIVQAGRVRTITDIAAGGTRTTTSTNRYDEIGRLVAKTDSADGVGDQCVSTEYADNTTLWIRTKVKQVTTSSEACPATGGPTAMKVTASVRTYYDNKTELGDVPGPGNATRADTATGNDNGTLTYATTGKTGYDAAGRTASNTDARNYTTTYAFTPSDGGVLSKTVITNPKGHIESVEADPARGLTTGTVDIGGRRTDTEYDALGRLKAAWKPGQVKGSTPASSTFDYVLRTDGPLAITSRALVDYGEGTSYITSVELRDSFGNVRQTQTDAVGGGRVVSDAFYDSHGWKKVTNNRYLTSGAPATSMVSVAASAVDDRTVYTYDGSGRPTVSAAYKGLTQTWQTRTIYGGDRLTELPPKGGVATTSVTDSRGRMVELRRYKTPPAVNSDVVTGGTYEAAQYRFNAIGQQDQVTDSAGNVWTYKFDFLGRLHEQVDPDKGTSFTEYDLAGLVTSTKNARGQVTAYTHDELGRKTAAFDDSTSGLKRTSWTWDGAQNGVGKLFYTTRFTPTGNWLTGVASYNGRGEPAKQFTQVPSTETGLSGYHETLLGYTSTGQLTIFQPPTAGGLPGEAISITYDRFGRPDKTTGYNVYVDKSQYTPFGENSQFALGPNTNQAWLTYDYDAQTRRLTDVNLSAQQALPQIDHTRYSYDAVGNITRSVNTQGHGDTAPVRTQCFSYDPLSRLSSAWTTTDNCAGTPSTSKLGNVAPYWTSWTFKPGGLRESQTQHATAGDTTTSYTYPDPGPGSSKPHALSSTTTTGPGGSSNTVTYDYDASGNTTVRPGQSLTWDRENRLATVTTTKGVTSYLYDGDGGQLLKREPGKATLYLPGQEWTRDTSTGVVTGTRYYTHNGVTIAVRVGNTNPRYLVTDQHNTASVAVDAVTFAVTRRTMDPYGNAIGAVEGGTWPDARGFLGKPTSADTGLTDIGARKYDSATGRFISVDPVLNLADPDQLCGYTYAENNPVTRSDPSGELTILGVGDAGIREALGMANDIRIMAGRSYLVAHISLQWGYIEVWRQNFIGPQIPIYLPAVLITIWFTTMPNCPTPQPQSNQPRVGPDPLTRAERAAFNKSHPPIVTHTPKAVKEQIRDLIVGLTGVDKMTDCVLKGSVGDCVLGFGPLVAGPLAKGAVAIGSKIVGAGAEVALNTNRVYGIGRVLPRTQETVCQIACKYGIDLDGVEVRINLKQANPEGSTRANQVVTLRRDAFYNEETLARTLAHERHHVTQLREGWKYPRTKEEATPFEQDAYSYEYWWWATHGKAIHDGG